MNPTTITVDYGQTLVELIEAGQYDKVRDEITIPLSGMRKWGYEPVKDENRNRYLVYRPRGRIDLSWSSPRDPEVVQIQLINFDGMRSDVFRMSDRLDRRGLRPATFPELLAFSSAFPKLQQQRYPIAAIGSCFCVSGHPHYPVLTGDVDYRYLGLHSEYYCSVWPKGFRFLAVRK